MYTKLYLIFPIYKYKYCHLFLFLICGIVFPYLQLILMIAFCLCDTFSFKQKMLWKKYFFSHWDCMIVYLFTSTSCTCLIPMLELLKHIGFLSVELKKQHSILKMHIEAIIIITSFSKDK